MTGSEAGIHGFRVWSFGPSRNDEPSKARMTIRFSRQISRRRFLSAAATGAGVLAMPYLSRAADRVAGDSDCHAGLQGRVQAG